MTTIRAFLASSMGLSVMAAASIGVFGDPGQAAVARRAACEATLVPDRLTISPRPVRVLAEAPRPLGEVERVRPSPGSGIEVLGAERDRPPGRTWVLQLDLRDASPGEWELELEGSDRTCAGSLELREAGSDVSEIGAGSAG